MYDDFDIVAAACSLLDTYAPTLIHVDYNWYLIARLVTWDFLVFIAYMIIPIQLDKIISVSGTNIGDTNTWRLFMAFIRICGIGHLLAIGTLFIPNWIILVSWYGAFTAIISLMAAISIIMTTAPITDNMISISKNTVMLQVIENDMCAGRWNVNLVTGHVTWSDGMYDLYGISKGQKLDVDQLDTFIHHNDIDRIKQNRTSMFDDMATSNTISYRIVTNNDIKYLNAMTRIEYDGMNPTNMYGIIIDMTNSVREMERYQRTIEYKNEVLEFVAYMIRHNLGGSLNAIEFAIQELGLVMDDVDVEKYGDFLDIIKLGAKKSISLHRAAVMYTNTIKRDTDIQKTEINIYDTLTTEFTPPELTVSLNLKHYNVVANHELFLLMIDNFLSNAIKHNSKEHRTIIIYKQGSSIIIEDNGDGFPVDEYDRLKRPFQRSNTKTSGDGLGLSICNAVANMHNWSIDVTSKPGEYTKFEIKNILK